MIPSLRTPPVYKKGAAFAMVARAASGSVECTTHEWAEKSLCAVCSVESLSTNIHLKPSGAVGCDCLGLCPLKPVRPAASLIPSRIARLSTSYEIQIEAINAMNKTAISNTAARAIMTSKFCMSGPLLNGVSDCDSAAQVPRNAHQWRAIGDFLEVQQLALLGLSRVAVRETQAGGGPGAQRPDASGLREANPVGNTGYTYQSSLPNHG